MQFSKEINTFCVVLLNCNCYSVKHCCMQIKEIPGSDFKTLNQFILISPVSCDNIKYHNLKQAV